MQIQISWPLQKPNDLDLHYLPRQGMSCSPRNLWKENSSNIPTQWINQSKKADLNFLLTNQIILNLCASLFDIGIISDLIMPGLVTNGTAKICCRGLILALFYSTMVIKNYFGL